MSYFRVSPEELAAGSSVVTRSPDGALNVLSGVAGAAAMTPADGAWTAFVDRATPALTQMDAVAADLARALSAAAGAYSRSDSTAATSLEVKR